MRGLGEGHGAMVDRPKPRGTDQHVQGMLLTEGTTAKLSGHLEIKVLEEFNMASGNVDPVLTNPDRREKYT